MPFGQRGLQFGVVAGLVLAVLQGALGVPPKNELDRLPAAGNLLPAVPLTSEQNLMAAASGPYASLNVTWVSQVTPQSFSTNSSCSISPTNSCANDIWGYVSPSGREYAILGLRSGTGFVDVTDARHPFVVGAIADATSLWSDMRTYQQYGYNVNESGGGLQVFDLSQIDPPTRQVSLVGSITQSGLNTVHNLTLNEASGYLYLCGANIGSGRLIAMSLANPASPVIVGQMVQSTYVHDAQVVNYTEGPYAGREIAFCFCGSAGLKIVDVTNKSNMFTMATMQYPNRTYCHQGGLSADRRYLFIDDELDELQNPNVSTTTTYVVDVQDLTNPVYVTSFTSGMPSIDHNLFVKGDFVFEANYTSGLRIFNVSDVQNVVEVGWFDSYTFNNGVSFNGAWGTYPYLPSGNVLLSDQYGGLFVLDVSDALADPCETTSAPQAESLVFPKNRYLSVTPANAGVQTAIRVRLTDLPSPFESFEGTEMWVDVPEVLVDSVNPVTTIKRSRLSCDPVFHDFGAAGPITISDHEIVPGGAYEIQQVTEGCDTGVEANYSAALAVATSGLWGDLIGSGFDDPPNGDTNFTDIAGLVDKFRGSPGAPGLAKCDLSPSETDGNIDFTDIAMCVNAFRGVAYPYSGPLGCP